MIGTTRSRVSFFMNRFRKLGFIDSLIITGVMNCRFTVHFSTSFSTTRTSFRKMCECRFGRLFLGFLLTHSPHDVTSANHHRPI
jgi:hypothetical protein